MSTKSRRPDADDVEETTVPPGGAQNAGDAAPVKEPKKEVVDYQVDASTTVKCEVTATHDNGLVDLQELVPDTDSPTGSKPGRWFQNVSRDLLK